MKLKRLAFGGVIAGFILVICLGLEIKSMRDYYSKVRHILADILALAGRRPTGISAEVWEDAVKWTVNAHIETFFSPSYTSSRELKRFSDDFATKVEEASSTKVDFDTLEWIWDRLEATGNAGKNYSTKFRPLFRELKEESRMGGKQFESHVLPPSNLKK